VPIGTGQISGAAFADLLFVVFAHESALVPPLQVFSTVRFQFIHRVYFGLKAISDR
jgi:hypothetical protein